MLFKQLHIQLFVHVTATLLYLDMCGKLPGTFTLCAVLGPMNPRTVKPFYHLFDLDVTQLTVFPFIFESRPIFNPNPGRGGRGK